MHTHGFDFDCSRDEKKGGLLHIRPNILKVQSRGLVGQLGHRNKTKIFQYLRPHVARR